MPIALTDDGAVIDVQVVHDRVALVVDDRTLWLDAGEVERLRQKLVLVARELGARVVQLPEPRTRR